MIRLIAFLVSFAFCGACRADDAVAQFTALEEAWSAAIRSQDRDEIERFLAPEYSLTVAMADGLQTVDRENWLKNAVGVYRLEDFRFDEVVVRQFGDTAIVSSRYSQKAKVGERDRSGEFFLTDVWVKAGEDWRVASRYSSRLEARKPKTP